MNKGSIAEVCAFTDRMHKNYRFLIILNKEIDEFQEVSINPEKLFTSMGNEAELISFQSSLSDYILKQGRKYERGKPI